MRRCSVQLISLYTVYSCCRHHNMRVLLHLVGTNDGAMICATLLAVIRTLQIIGAETLRECARGRAPVEKNLTCMSYSWNGRLGRVSNQRHLPYLMQIMRRAIWRYFNWLYIQTRVPGIVTGVERFHSFDR